MSDTSQEGYVALGLQAEQGTPAAAVTTGVKVTSVDVGATTENLIADAEIGGGRDRYAEGVALGSVHVAGDLEGYLRYDALGYLLLMAGFVEDGGPVQDGETGAYEHTFVPGDFTRGTIETAWGRNRAIRRAVDCLVGDLELSVSANDYATFSASVVGLAEEWLASPSVPTFAALDAMGTYLGSVVTFPDLGTFRWADLSLTVANNVSDDEEVLGQRELADTTPGRREVSFSGTIRPQGTAQAVTDLYRAAAYGDPTLTSPGTSDVYHTPAVVTFGSPKLIGTSTTHRYGVTFTMPDVVVNAFPLEGSGDDPIEASIEANAFAGEDPVVTVTLRNARATGYAPA